jgi:hypothetical protein
MGRRVGGMSIIASPSELRPRLRGTIGVDGYLQLLLRMGYGSEVKPTPRRTVEEIISLEG